MPWSLRRYQQSRQTHYITFSCYRRLQKLGDALLRDLMVKCLEQTRRRFELRVYGFVLMPYCQAAEFKVSSMATMIFPSTTFMA
jgi:putative transposase